ncbi:hypothetical protein C0J52_19359, partial [Blattella germanica]
YSTRSETSFPSCGTTRPPKLWGSCLDGFAVYFGRMPFQGGTNGGDDCVCDFRLYPYLIYGVPYLEVHGIKDIAGSDTEEVINTSNGVKEEVHV